MRVLGFVCLLCCLTLPSAAIENAENVARQVLSEFPSAQMVENPATGSARLLVFDGSQRPTFRATKSADQAIEALDRFAAVFGVTDVRDELQPSRSRTDIIGQTHSTYVQQYQGVPVYGGLLRVHVDSDHGLRAINGAFVPGINIDSRPRVSPVEAADAALMIISKDCDPFDLPWLEASDPILYVYNTGLTRGRKGTNHLVWETQVSDSRTIRELVYLDAHTGALVERINMIQHLERTIHSRNFGSQIWNEGDATPYSSGTSTQNNEVNGLIDTSAETFQFYSRLSGGDFLSWDGSDSTMHSVEDLVYDECPNAFWNGQSTNFCRGMVSDDVAAHEWTHAFTEGTHRLIYLWQPGALNESYSDIFGESIDLVNNRGSDTPGTIRIADSCSVVGGSSPSEVEIHAPEGLAGPMEAAGAAFNPLPPWTVRGQAELVDDGVGTVTDACEGIDGFTAGRIAVIHRGECSFHDKVTHALAAGAIAAIVVNNQGDGVLTMGGNGRLAIPSVIVGQSDGAAIIASLEAGVDVTLMQAPTTDQSLRWLIGEDTQIGAMRDMWRPSCFDDPGKTTSGFYACTDSDNGGVHTNSGVPNHAYALAVDGGVFNGIEVEGIGLTRAAHVWWRAMSVYQVPTTGFADHADLIGLACTDLVGVPLTDPATGATSADTINAGHCAEIEEAMDAVEMRTPPSQCRFVPLLQPDAPSVGIQNLVFSEEFDADFAGSEGGWQMSNAGVYSVYDPRDWVWTTDEPSGGFGDGAAFAIDSVFIGDCNPGSDDQSGVMHLESPSVVLPASAANAVLIIDHYIATENEYDGATISVSANDMPYRNILPQNFRHNPYNSALTSSGNTNPLAGQWAFNGTNGGSLEGSWGQSQIELAHFAGDGDSIRIRFSLGVDGCNGVEGWYLDRVRIVIDGEGPRSPDGRAGR